MPHWPFPTSCLQYSFNVEQFQEPYSGHENESHTLRMMEQKKTQGIWVSNGILGYHTKPRLPTTGILLIQQK